jgi:hypothetical protein
MFTTGLDWADAEPAVAPSTRTTSSANRMKRDV